MNTVLKKILLLLSISTVFITGFYLRSYYSLNNYIASTPYELIEQENFNSSDTSEVVNFIDKADRYNLSYKINNSLPDFFKDFYWIYILIGLSIMFFGYLMSGSYIGGITALVVLSITGENLIFYTKTIGSSGLSYTLLVLFLVFTYLFITEKKNIYLLISFIFLFLNTFSYHNGATAGVVISFSILVSLFLNFLFDKYSNKNKKNNKEVVIKYSVLFLVSLSIYLIYIIKYDIHQMTQVASLASYTPEKIHAVSIIVFAFITTIVLRHTKSIKKNFVYILAGVFSLGLFLIFYDKYILNILEFVPIQNYYVSPITLNNYLAQILITHLIILFFLKDLLCSKDSRMVFLRGWFLSLTIIFIGLSIKGYYVRILDYSIPFVAILWSMYISENYSKKLLRVLFLLSLLLICISQIRIFQDPFSMRRYYEKYEFTAALNISHHLDSEDYIFSDLRTAALFSSIGLKNIEYSVEDNSLHSIFFYDLSLISKTEVEYLIISDKMSYILYSANFPTTPLKRSDFEYYIGNFYLVDYQPPFYLYNVKDD